MNLILLYQMFPIKLTHHTQPQNPPSSHPIFFNGPPGLQVAMFKAAKLLWQYKGFRYKIKLTTTHLLRHSLEVIPHTILPGRAVGVSEVRAEVERFFWLTDSIIHQPEITPNLGGFP